MSWGGEVVAGSDGGEVGGEVFVEAGREVPEAALGRGAVGALGEGEEVLAEGGAVGVVRVVVDGEGVEGGNDVGDAVEVGVTDESREGEDAGVERRVDAVAEFDGPGAVAEGEEAGSRGVHVHVQPFIWAGSQVTIPGKA